jgi:hypothetical protein
MASRHPVPWLHQSVRDRDLGPHPVRISLLRREQPDGSGSPRPVHRSRDTNPCKLCSGRYWARTSDVRLVEAEAHGQDMTGKVKKSRYAGDSTGRPGLRLHSDTPDSILRDAPRTQPCRSSAAGGVIRCATDFRQPLGAGVVMRSPRCPFGSEATWSAFRTQARGMPSAGPSSTSVGSPRMFVVASTTKTSFRWSIASFRVSTRATEAVRSPP